MSQKKVIKLTNTSYEEILIGVESIISVRPELKLNRSKITSREAMVETNYVIQTVEEIFNQINDESTN